ncbi:MAG TPA: MATE family efflux transporter [Vicinamibacterales bacterium]|jgi:putative MATE family efflux protein
MLGGLQGIVDHVMVGHYVGYTGNAAIGVGWQIFLVVVVFIASLYTGMGVLVARFAGANDSDKVNRVVYQAFLTSIVLALGILAPIGYLLSPRLLELIHAAPEVRAEALPYLRTMFVCSLGQLLYFMLAGALRAAGDARTPLRIGLSIVGLNIALNMVLIRGAGPIPGFGAQGAALGTSIAAFAASGVGIWLLATGRVVVRFSRGMSMKPDWAIIRSLFRFGLPAGVQGVAMNVAGVLLLRFIGSLSSSAEAQAAYAVGYTELFSFITWTSVGLMGAAAAVAGQNLGAGRPDRSVRAVNVAARFGLTIAASIGLVFLFAADHLLGFFGLNDPTVLMLGRQLLRYLSVSGLFITVALTYTGGLQGTGDTRSPLFITLVSQIGVPIGLCTYLEATGRLEASWIWLAIVLGHFTRALLSTWVFRRGRWRTIAVDVPSAQ